LTILDENENIIQNIRQPIGFKKQEIKDGVFYVNNEVAEIRGVNRHEHDARFAHAVGHSEFAFNRTDMIEDLLLIKSLGFNAVRTAHYPNHPMFYELCDSLGLWVCDEANVEAHFYMMFRPFRNITKDPNYREAIKERIYNMYQRDKNFTSIIMWSVGNENGTGKTMVEAYDMLKSLDTLRPVFNERHFFLNLIKKKHSDFNGNMYAKPENVKKIVKKDKEKPFIWIEYAHAMGNSTGNFTDLWEFIRSEPKVQGGFIWDWRDQGLWTKNSEGIPFLGYGGHFEPKGVRHDGNFCANGVISADGKLHPAAYEIQYVHQNPTSNNSSKQKFAPEKIEPELNTSTLALTKNDNIIKVTHPEFEAEWTNKGKLKSYKINNEEIIQGFGLNFWRASTDNDFGNRMPKKAKRWRKVTENQLFYKVKSITESAEGIQIVALYKLPKGKKGVVTYQLSNNGELNFNFDLPLKSKNDIPRVGSYLILNQNQSVVTYNGNGPHENYSDRKASANFGTYNLDISSQEIPYIRPQEYGNRTEVSLVNFPNFQITPTLSPINFSAWNHSLWQIDEFPKKTGLVPIDVKPAEFIWANFDLAQRGLGGDNSWGRKPYKQYLLKNGRYNWEYKLIPKKFIDN
jgi:beta-galactosidase/beta-glucuronidase